MGSALQLEWTNVAVAGTPNGSFGGCRRFWPSDFAQDLGAGQDVEWDADGLRLVSFVTDEGTRQSWKLAAR